MTLKHFIKYAIVNFLLKAPECNVFQRLCIWDLFFNANITAIYVERVSIDVMCERTSVFVRGNSSANSATFNDHKLSVQKSYSQFPDKKKKKIRKPIRIV